MKKSFSLLETIIVIALIAIISSMGVYKLFFNVNNSNSLQIKTQMHLIKNGIVKKNNEQILLAQVEQLSSLDDASNNTKNQMLFSNILNQPLISTNEIQKTIAKWIKLSNTQYKIYINASQSIVFTYNSAKATFDCDDSNEQCKELYQ